MIHLLLLLIASLGTIEGLGILIGGGMGQNNIIGFYGILFLAISVGALFKSITLLFKDHLPLSQHLIVGAALYAAIVVGQAVFGLVDTISWGRLF
jgi:hypothetical protein